MSFLKVDYQFAQVEYVLINGLHEFTVIESVSCMVNVMMFVSSEIIHNN